jgi:hypothetical protein
VFARALRLRFAANARGETFNPMMMAISLRGRQLPASNSAKRLFTKQCVQFEFSPLYERREAKEKAPFGGLFLEFS